MYVTCYTYYGLWEGFFKLREKYLDKNIKMYFCTDLIKDYDLKQENTKLLNFNEKSILDDIKGNLYDRYLFYLNNIDTDYILFFYDDMYPIEKISNEKIEKLINIMENNKNIKLIKLSGYSFPFHNGKENIIDEIPFFKANNNLDDYIFNLHPQIIRKDFFIEMIKYVKKNNNIHQDGGLEVYGTQFFKEKTDYIAMRANESIIKIISPTGVVINGVIEDTIKFFLKEKENIEIKTYKNNLIYELTNEEYKCMSGSTIAKLKKRNIIP